MKILDPGHIYDLDWLDGQPFLIGMDWVSVSNLPREVAENRLVFVKREGEKYPGNVGHHPGTNMQEVLRALIDRVKYVHKQQWDFNNTTILNDLRHVLYLLEERAARLHGRSLELSPPNIQMEDYSTCKKCGHIGCEGDCHR